VSSSQRKKQTHEKFTQETPHNQMYLFIMETGPELHSSQPESFHAKAERNSNKKEIKNIFQVSSWQWKQQTHENFTQETTIKRTGCPGNADGFSKRMFSSYKTGREETTQRWEVYYNNDFTTRMHLPGHHGEFCVCKLTLENCATLFSQLCASFFMKPFYI